MAALILLILIVGMGAAALLGLTADSRDPDYALGRVLRPHPKSPRAVMSTGNLPSSAPVAQRIELPPSKR
jgi:hypothetical protein